MGYKSITDEQYEAGRAAGRVRLSSALRAESVRFDSDSQTVVIRLSDKVSVGVSKATFTEWDTLSDDEMRDIRLSAVRDALAVGTHDVQVSIEGLLRDVMPEPLLNRAFAQRGGAATSPAKALAARVNGARGGRPKKAVSR